MPPSPRNGFLAHKYLLVAIVECLQAQHRRRTSTTSRERDPAAVHRWMREPSAEREVTPCVVMRERQDRGDLTVTKVALDRMAPGTRPLADWMRRVAPASSEPDQDTLHLAMAPTLPGVPILVHSMGGQGESFTHLFSGGVWTLCRDDQFLLRAIRYAQLVATAIPLSHALVGDSPTRAIPPSPVVDDSEDGAPCDLTTLGQVYDHIGVHAAIAELREFRHSRGFPRAQPLAPA
ncbi:hypothetical protein [Hydrogenophaga sp.]|uniref:hypothetical protein n=1 Tax=Hydrogenophaga sp. TaxID=1904254 RepID=UPI00272FD594|nr:hypothetical protein [Hydrogenophaga sp.]MDP1687480.1 hypothetical protein [Hydrogenophaga sp.]